MRHSHQKRPQVLLIIDFLSVVLICALFMFTSFNISANEDDLQQANHTLALENLSQSIDARIAQMKLIAKTIANDSHIHNWVDEGFNAKQEPLLVEKLGFLVEEYGLTSASFADKTTHKYWNHEGFLRVLQPDIDTWYFAYLRGGQENLISVYHDQNKHRVDVYVNYQQTDGNGLSGVATSFDGVVTMLETSSFAQQGEVYLVDAQGKVQVHANESVAGNATLQTLYSSSISSSLLTPNTPSWISVSDKQRTRLGASYIPSMGWYLVVAIDE
ncbi:chemotaxis protein [Glaciecola sp. XM2]|uniref:cache domain-containing protein n=1 Tax=Glaciecola sp. XM2 TaxID=1914931 RepID=UPI001BDE939F|nr:cache domain-containing protein [Glaciecola sp. XM2]MBT1451823.1 chemotaxis protein [Glaciecola sp. XM2]